MQKKIDEATKFLIDSLPENLRKLAESSSSAGFLSRMDFDSAIVADEIDESEKDEILSFFQQDLALDILESSVFLDDNVSYEDTEDSGPRDKSKDVLNADTEQVYVGDEDYEHYAKQLERSTTGGLTLGVQDSVQSYLKSIVRSIINSCGRSRNCSTNRGCFSFNGLWFMRKSDDNSRHVRLVSTVIK